MASLLSYAFRGLAPSLARGQAQRTQLMEQRRREEMQLKQQEAQQKAVIDRMVLMEGLRRRAEVEEEQRRAAAVKAAEAEKAAQALANLRSQAGYLGIPDADKLDAPTLGLRIPETQQGRERTRAQTETLTSLRSKARALGITGADTMDAPTLEVQIGDKQAAKQQARDIEKARENRQIIVQNPLPQRDQPLRQVPSAGVSAVVGNEKQLRVLDDAIQLVRANPDAFGFKNYLPGDFVQRAPGQGYRGGIDPRAAVADVGSLEIRDRSGAAVTVAEMPRLAPFIPKATDSPEKVLKNLQRMRRIIEDETRVLRETYSPEHGYRGIGGGGEQGAVRKPLSRIAPR